MGCWRSPTRSTSTSSTTAPGTSRWPRSRAWRTARSRSARCPRATPSPAGGSAGRSIRRVHDFVTVGAPTPFQEAGAVALRLPGSYYERLAADYTERRDLMLQILATAGLQPATTPAGAYYIMCDASVLGMGDDTATARALTREVG